MPRGVCPNGHRPDYLLAYYLVKMENGEFASSQAAIRLDPDTGLATNMWDDGTVGVPAYVVALAEDEGSVYCNRCMEVVRWVHHGDPEYDAKPHLSIDRDP